MIRPLLVEAVKTEILRWGIKPEKLPRWLRRTWLRRWYHQPEDLRRAEKEAKELMELFDVS